MAVKNNNHNEVVSWAQARVNTLKIKSKKNRKRYTILASIMALINLAIIVLAAVGLAILVKNKDKIEDGSTLPIVMTSIAAGLTIAIFFMNFANIIYRSLMRWHAYKDGADALQHEVLKYHVHDEYKKRKNPEEYFLHKIGEIYEEAISFKRHKNPWKLLLKALSGGDNV